VQLLYVQHTARGPHAAQSKVLGVVKVFYILTTFPYFDYLKIDIFVAGGPQCHFMKSAAIAVRIRTLSGH